jgi:hypothetical protein
LSRFFGLVPIGGPNHFTPLICKTTNKINHFMRSWRLDLKKRDKLSVKKWGVKV